MRVLLLIAAIVLLLALLGWISVSTGPNRSSINLETEEIKEDTGQVMESGADALRRAGEKIDEPASPQPLPSQEPAIEALPSEPPATLPVNPPSQSSTSQN